MARKSKSNQNNPMSPLEFGSPASKERDILGHLKNEKTGKYDLKLHSKSKHDALAKKKDSSGVHQRNIEKAKFNGVMGTSENYEKEPKKKPRTHADLTDKEREYLQDQGHYGPHL